MKFILTIALVVTATLAIGCEICGYASGGVGIGTIGASKYHLLGMSFQGRSFRSSHPSLFSNEFERSSEVFLATNLIGKYQIDRRFQLLGVAPFNFNQQEKNGTTYFTNGIGDIRLSSNYSIVYKRDTLSEKVFMVQIGTGVKFPSGNYSRNAHETTNLFPGTGSWDFPLETNIYWMKKKWMLQWENFFTLKTSNPVGYRYGNMFQSIVYVAKSWSFGSLKLSPGLGEQNELLMKDRINGSTSGTFNGGHLLSTVVGVNLEWKQFFLMLRFNHPMLQNLSNGSTVNKRQFGTSLFYIFKN